MYTIAPETSIGKTPFSNTTASAIHSRLTRTTRWTPKIYGRCCTRRNATVSYYSTTSRMTCTEGTIFAATAFLPTSQFSRSYGFHTSKLPNDGQLYVEKRIMRGYKSSGSTEARRRTKPAVVTVCA